MTNVKKGQTVAFEKLKSRLFADPKVKEEYDALADEFENSTVFNGKAQK